MGTREIKFRGRSLVNDKYNSIKAGDWVYGSYIESGCDAPCIIFGDGEQCEIDRETLGQYTGIENHDNIEIYESDIVYIAGYGNCVIEWDVSQWVFNPVGPHCSIDYCDACEDIEGTVGNIHENPELLTGN